MRVIESYQGGIPAFSGGVVFNFEDLPESFRDELESEGLLKEIQNNPKARMMRNVIDEKNKVKIADFGIFHNSKHYLTDS